MLIRVIQQKGTNSIETDRYRYIDIDIDKRRFITGIGSHSCGSQEVSQSTIHKLEDQESSGIIQSESTGPRTKSPYDQGQKKMDISAQGERETERERRENSSFLCLSVLSRSLTDWMTPHPHW